MPERGRKWSPLKLFAMSKCDPEDHNLQKDSFAIVFKLLAIIQVPPKIGGKLYDLRYKQISENMFALKLSGNVFLPVATIISHYGKLATWHSRISELCNLQCGFLCTNLSGSVQKYWFWLIEGQVGNIDEGKVQIVYVCFAK